MNIEERLMSHLQRLAVDIGPRPSGSQGNHAAAAYIQDVFRAAGLQVEEQRYACPAWRHQETCLELAGERLEAAANAFSPPCDVSAATVAIGTIAELEATELRGRVGVLYGDLTRSPLAAKSWPYKSERDERVVRLLEEKEPAALLTVQARAGSLERLIEDREFAIPSATVPASVGLALLRQGAPTVHLRVKSRRAAGHPCNVVARKAGTKQAQIVMCAHYDTKVDTPGASDNAGGVSVLLALAQSLSQREHALGLEWIAFSGEEYLPMGDDEYVRRCGDSFDKIMVAINLDGVGRYLGANNYTVMASSESFKAHVAELSQRYSGVVWVDPWPESNHSAFANRGVPSMALSSSSGGSVAHLRSDTVEQVSPAKLSEALSLVADIVGSLQDKPSGWTRRLKQWIHPMRALPSLDAHAHIGSTRTADELADSGIVLAMTNSLDEAALVVSRHEPNIVWGVGCHPRMLKAQELFDADLFRELAERTAVVGEIGLDGRSRRVPLEMQLQTFRQALEVLSDLPRLVSIHADGATRLVIEELEQRPVTMPVLHGWRGSVEETQEAVALGCYFSIHSGVARHSKFRTVVPPERLLIETDHHRSSLPAAIPCRVKWVEYIVAELLGVGVMDVRRLAWQNLGTIVCKTGTLELLPAPIAAIVAEM